jgi:hypothetical protein
MVNTIINNTRLRCVRLKVLPSTLSVAKQKVFQTIFLARKVSMIVRYIGPRLPSCAVDQSGQVLGTCRSSGTGGAAWAERHGLTDADQRHQSTLDWYQLVYV